MKSAGTRNESSVSRVSQARLLDAAEELFARHGLEGASVREVTAKAKCNIAAVNYHFGDKDRLYEEVFRRRLAEMREKRVASIEKTMASRDGATVEKLIRAYANAFMEPFADRKVSERLLMLFVREMVEQRLPKKMFLEEMAVPVMEPFEAALRKLCPYLTRGQARMAIHSIVGQLVHIIHMALLPARAEGLIGRFDEQAGIEHIVEFSAAGIKAYGRGKR